MKKVLFSLLFLCITTSLLAQCDCKINMSFERAEGGCFGQNCACNCLPDNGQDTWEQCTKWGCGSTDIEPNGNLSMSGVNAIDGKTFMSMTCGPQGEGNSLKLCEGAPLKAGEKYCFDISLIKRNGSASLALYGADSPCNEGGQELWVSDPATDEWAVQPFCFTPSSAWKYISFRVVGGSGVLGIDKWVSTTGNFPPQPDVTACDPSVSVKDTSVCANGCTQLTAVGKGGTPGYTYVWSDNQKGATITVCPGTNPQTMTVTLKDAAGKTATASAKINIFSPPTVVVTTAAICKGGSATLTASGATTYSWSLGTGLNTTTGSTVTANPSVTTTYTVVGTNATGCKDTTTTTVTVHVQPDVQATGGSICLNDSIQLKAEGALTYAWTPAATLSNPASATPVAYPLVNTTYTVIGTDAFGCKDTATANVIISDKLVVTVSKDTSMCAGEPVQLIASGGNKFLWTPATGLSDPTIANPIATPLVTTEYEVQVSSGSCTGTKKVMLTVNPAPVMDVNNPGICKGMETTLTASGAASYSWMAPGGVILSSTASITIQPSTTTSYTVTGSNANGCTSMKTATVTVNAIPDIAVNSGSICKGKSFTIKAVGGATLYSWIASDGSSLPMSDQVVVQPVSDATYTVTGTVNGCSDTAISHVTVHPVPVITVTNAGVCLRQEVHLTANGGTSYTWSTGANTASIVVAPTVTTSYTVTGTNAGCSNTATAVVSVYGNPSVSFYPNIRELSEDEPRVTFFNSSTGKNLKYEWNFGDVAGPSNTSNELNPTHVYTTPGVYTVCLKATDSLHGCIDSTCKNIVYKPNWTIYVPNAFTPGDASNEGLNNVFYAYGTNILKFRMLIFDRWGNQIFESNDLYKGWDGTMKGKQELVQKDVYVWKIDLTDVFNKEHQYIGHVTVVK